MKYIHGTTEFHIEEECVLSLGKFDGLHRGHETLLEHMMEQMCIRDRLQRTGRLLFHGSISWRSPGERS